MSGNGASVDDQTFKVQLTDLIPHLRAFARSLCGDAAAADDLAQDAMLRAWRSRGSYEGGTNMKAWAFTILRNAFYSEKRRSWRTQPLDMDVAANTLVALDASTDKLELLALRNALAKLPLEQKEAILLVGAGGLSYEDAATICETAVGTIKSRVSRARAALTAILESNGAGFGSDDDIRGDEAFGDILRQVDLLTGPVSS